MISRKRDRARTTEEVVGGQKNLHAAKEREPQQWLSCGQPVRAVDEADQWRGSPPDEKANRQGYGAQQPRSGQEGSAHSVAIVLKPQSTAGPTVRAGWENMPSGQDARFKASA